MLQKIYENSMYAAAAVLICAAYAQCLYFVALGTA
jgi:hypothetical protein